MWNLEIPKSLIKKCDLMSQRKSELELEAVFTDQIVFLFDSLNTILGTDEGIAEKYFDKLQHLLEELHKSIVYGFDLLEK